ncbi:uncharacterized protein LOC144121838 [Amblyomma americanum]
MKTVWLLLSLVGLTLAASLGDIEPSGLIGRRELRRPALLLEAQRLNHGAAGRRQGVLFKTLSNFGGRRRLSAPPDSDVAPPSDASSIESGSDDAVASLINRFGGVIQQKRRLGDDDAVSEDGDDLIARSSGTKGPLTGIGGDDKTSESDSGQAWTPTYGGTYRPEPQLQSNYKALLSEPEFDPSVPPGDSYAAVVGGGTVSAQVTGPTSETSDRKEQGKLEESTNADGQPAAKTEDSKDCKDKNGKMKEEGGAKLGDSTPGMNVEVDATHLPDQPGTSDPQPPSTKESPSAGKHDSATEEIDYVDDDDDYEEDEEHSAYGNASKKSGSPSSHAGDKTATPASVTTGAADTGSDSNLPATVSESGGSTTGYQPQQVVGSEPTTGTTAELDAMQQNDAALSRNEAAEGSPVRAETLGQNLDQPTSVQVSPISGQPLSSAVSVSQGTQTGEVVKVPSSAEEGPGQPPSLPKKDASVSAGSPVVISGENSGPEHVQNAGVSSSAQANVERGPDGAPQIILQPDSKISPNAEVVVGRAIAASIKEVQLEADDALKEGSHSTSESTTFLDDSGQDNNGGGENVGTADLKAGKSPEDCKDDVTGSDTKEQKSISDAHSEPSARPEGQPGIPQGQEQLKDAVALSETPSSLPNPGREQTVVNGINRQAAEAEILTFLKQRASKQDTTVKSSSPQEFATVSARVSGQDGTIVSTGGGADTGRNDQHNGPTLFNQNGAAVFQPQAPSINAHGQPLLPQSGLSIQTTKVALPSSQVFNPGTVPGSGIPGYTIPLDPGVYYPVGVSGSHDASGSIFAQGSFPADTAGFVAETPAVGAPSVANETNATVSATPSKNESKENASLKPADQHAASEEPEKNSNDLGVYKAASSLEGPMTGSDSKNTAPNVEDAASTSFIAGTDSLSTEKGEKLALYDLKEPAGGSMGRVGFQGISINVTDTQTPIDVSGIVMTAGDNESSVPPLSKHSTTITDSTKTVVVEGGSSDMPIDVSGIATSSETPADDKESPSQAPEETGSGNGSFKTFQNETGPPSASDAGGPKTKDDCKDDEKSSGTEKSPHGKPVVFGSAADPTSSLQGANENHQQDNVVGGVSGTAVSDNSAVTIQSDAPNNESVLTSSGKESTPNSGETIVKDADSQTRNDSQDAGIGYVVSTKLSFSADENRTSTSTPQPTTEAATVSSPKSETTDGSPASTTATTKGEVSTPSPQAADDQKDDRELGGADAPEPPERKPDKTSEKSIAAVISEMMRSNESSEASSALSDGGSNVQTVTSKYTPLPISSVSISDVGPSTATLPALGYATVKEIQIATQPALDPRQSSVSSSGAVPGAEEPVDGRSLTKIEVIEGVAVKDSVPAFKSSPDEVMQTVTTTSAPLTDVVSTTIKYANQDISNLQPETVKNEPLGSQELPIQTTSAPESTTLVPEPAETERTAAAQSSATEAPSLGTISDSGAEPPPMEKSTLGLQAVSTEAPSTLTDVVAVKVVNNSVPSQAALPTEPPSAESSTRAAGNQASVEGASELQGSSPQAPLVTAGESFVTGAVGAQDGVVYNSPSTDAPSASTSTSAANVPAVPESTTVSFSSSTEKSAPSTSVDVATETMIGSTPLPTSSSTGAPATTENPDVATIPTVTESTTAAPSTTERTTTPSTTEETRTLPSAHLPRRPQIKPLGGAKRPLFNIARPPSFATTVGQRRFKPADRVNNEGIDATPPTTAQPPLRSQTLNIGDNVSSEEKEDIGVRVVEAPGIQFRRPHFPRPASADRRVAPGGKPPGRNAGRRRKPGSRGGHRRTTTTPPPQDTTTAPSALEEIEETSPGQPSAAQFGARIGARVTQTSRRLLPTTEQTFNTAPASADRGHSRPAKPRRTKRPRLPPVTRPSATEYNDVRFAQTTSAFASTRIPVVKEAAYETTHEAYITEIAPASTTYRTKSPLVAEVTLPSTEDDRNSVSSAEYDEPLSDEPELPSAPESGPKQSVLPGNMPSLQKAYNDQLLRKEQGVNTDSILAGQLTEAPESYVKTPDTPASEGIQEPTTLGNVGSEPPGAPLDKTGPALSTLAPTTPYGTKLATSLNSATETLNEFSTADSEGVENGVKFYPTRYHPQHTTKVPTTQALPDAPTDPSTETTSGQATNTPSESEEFLPSTPELDIPRIPTTPAPKPVQTLPTTKYPPLPDPPANPVAVFLVEKPGQAQNIVPEGRPPVEPGKDAQVVLGVAPTSTTRSPTATAQSEPSQLPQAPQFISTKRPEVDVPPSYLIPNTPDQVQPNRPTQKPVYVAQTSTPQTKPPAMVTQSLSNTLSTVGVTLTVASQQDAGVSTTPQVQTPQPQTTVRPQSGSAAGYAQAVPGASQPSKPSLGGAQPSTTGEREPFTFAPSQNSQPNLQYNQLSGTYRSRPLAQHPNAASFPPSASTTAAPRAPPAPPGPPSTKFPISTTRRPRPPSSYVPLPAFLQPLGLQVQPFVVATGPKKQSGQQARPQVDYAHSLGLQVPGYQPTRVQEPTAPTSLQGPARPKTQTPGVHPVQLPIEQRRPSPTPGSLTAPKRPAFSSSVPVQEPNGQLKRPSSTTAQDRPVQPGFILPLGLQTAYIPPVQEHSRIDTSSQGVPLSEPRVPQGTQAAAVKPSAPKRPQYSVVRAQQQAPISGQVVQHPGAGVPKPVLPLRVAYQTNKATGANAQAPGAPAKVQVQSFGVSLNAPLQAPNQQKAPSAFIPPQVNVQLGTTPSPQQPRPFSPPQFQPGQRPRIGQAHTRIYFSPPIPQKLNGTKPVLPVSPFFLSIRHDQVVQEDIPFPKIGKPLSYKQTIPADIVLPPQKVARPVTPGAPSRKPSSASETLLQIPQTPRPARVQAQKSVASRPASAGKKPITPAQERGVVRQVILSPATGPIPYLPQTLVSAGQTAPQQGTQGVYKVRTYVPVASAFLPGRPDVTATSYVPTTPNGQVLKVTSVAKPTYSSSNQAVVQNSVQGTAIGTSAPSNSASQPGTVLVSAKKTASAPANTAQGQPSPGTQILVPQGLVPAPQQQQVVQVTSYVPSGSPQSQQAQGAYVSQLPVQQSYSRGQQPSLGLQVPIVYASAPHGASQAQYYPGAAGVIGHLKQYPQQQYAQQQYPQQQFQTLYAVPPGQITLAQVSTRTSGAIQGASHPVYLASGIPALQQGASPNTGAQGYAPIVYQRPPVTLLSRRPVYAYQSPVYVAASPHQLSQGAAKLASAVSPFRQPLGLSVG